MNDAALYYESESQGLGARFLDEIERCIALIVKNPNAGIGIRGNVRRSILRKFGIRGVLVRLCTGKGDKSLLSRIAS